MKKRFIASVMLLLLVITALVGCTLFDSKSENSSGNSDNEISWSEL